MKQTTAGGTAGVPIKQSWPQVRVEAVVAVRLASAVLQTVQSSQPNGSAFRSTFESAPSLPPG